MSVHGPVTEYRDGGLLGGGVSLQPGAVPRDGGRLFPEMDWLVTCMGHGPRPGWPHSVHNALADARLHAQPWLGVSFPAPGTPAPGPSPPRRGGGRGALLGSLPSPPVMGGGGLPPLRAGMKERWGWPRVSARWPPPQFHQLSEEIFMNCSLSTPSFYAFDLAVELGNHGSSSQNLLL